VADEEVVHDLARQKTNIIIGEFSKRGSIKGSNIQEQDQKLPNLELNNQLSVFQMDSN
jgi:hypothetical protein|tara:strand:- start:378 stop:551 length:174 start_codon:yes stop_codon:yes gene_type:complete